MIDGDELQWTAGELSRSLQNIHVPHDQRSEFAPGLIQCADDHFRADPGNVAQSDGNSRRGLWGRAGHDEVSNACGRRQGDLKGSVTPGLLAVSQVTHGRHFTGVVS